MTVFTVSTAAQLKTALSTAKGGDTIKMADGNYGAVSLSGYKFTSDVTITSADGDKGAVFSTLSIANSSNLRIDSVHVSTGTNSGTAGVTITGSSNIDFVNSEVNGKVDKVYPISGPSHGIYVTDGCSNIVIQNNYVHDVLNGVTNFGTKNLTVADNTVDYVGSDAFKFSAVNTAVIEGNTGPRFIHASSTAHSDFMQFQGGGSSNVVIKGNVLFPENYLNMQGIFVAGNGGHKNITIQDNVIATAMHNGIYVASGSTGITIDHNTVLNMLNDTGVTALVYPSGASVTNNIYSGKTGGLSGTNVVVQHTDPNAAYHYEDLFTGNFRDKGLFTLEDLRPVAGSLGTSKGAYKTVASELSGDNIASTPTPPAPEPEPDPVTETPAPDTGSDSGNDPGADLVYVRNGDTEFNGTKSSVVTVAHTSDFAIEEGTIALSFDADTVAGTRAILSKDGRNYDGGGNHFSVWVQNGQLVVRFQDEDSDKTFKVSGIKANREYDVVATFDEDSVSVYLDNKLVGSGDFVMDWTANTQKLMLGGFSWTSKQVFDGTISDVQIYDEAMTPTDYDFFA